MVSSSEASRLGRVQTADFAWRERSCVKFTAPKIEKLFASDTGQNAISDFQGFELRTKHIMMIYNPNKLPHGRTCLTDMFAILVRVIIIPYVDSFLFDSENVVMMCVKEQVHSLAYVNEMLVK